MYQNLRSITYYFFSCLKEPLNHSCKPNCEPDEVGGGIVIKALRFIWPGEELTFDYDLFSDEPMTDTLKARYACRCGAKKCRGTMLGVTA